MPGYIARMPLDLVFCAGFLALLGAAYLSYRATQRDLHAERAFAAVAVRTSGRVVELTPGHRPTPDRPTAFRPVVEFVRHDGATVRVATLSAQAPAPARLGQEVEIAVDPYDESRIELADRVSGPARASRWATPVGFAVLAGILAAAAAVLQFNGL